MSRHVPPIGEARLPSAMLFGFMLSGLGYAGFVFAVPAPVVADLARAYGGGAQGAFIAQLAHALPSLGMMISGVISGWVFQRAGLRLSLLTCLLAFAVFGSAALVIHAPWLMLGTRLLLGVAAGMLAPGVTMLVSQTYEGPARARVIGYQSACGSVASLVALLVSGLVAQSMGWRASFAIYAVVGLSAFLVALPSLPAGRGTAEAAARSAGNIFRRLWPLYGGATLLMLVSISLGGLVPLLLADRGVTAPIVQAVVLAMVATVAMLGGLAYGRLRRALGGKRVFALGLMLGGVGMLIMGGARGALDTGFGAALLGAAEGLYLPHLWSRTAELAPESARGHALGYLSTAFFLGGFSYPFVIKPLQFAFGLDGACVAIGLALAAAAVAAVAVRESPFAEV